MSLSFWMHRLRWHYFFLNCRNYRKKWRESNRLFGCILPQALAQGVLAVLDTADLLACLTKAGNQIWQLLLQKCLALTQCKIAAALHSQSPSLLDKDGLQPESSCSSSALGKDPGHLVVSKDKAEAREQHNAQLNRQVVWVCHLTLAMIKIAAIPCTTLSVGLSV